MDKSNKEAEVCRLTQKQQALVRAILDAPPGTSDKDIMLRAGYSPNQPTTNIINNAKIVSALQTALERKGITTDLLAEVMYDGLTAREDHNDIMSKPERMVRLKYLEKILKLLGAENDAAPSQSYEQTITSITINNGVNESTESKSE